MKKYIMPLLTALTFVATSCSSTRGGNSIPNLAGNWKMGGPYNVGKSCQMFQDGVDLTFLNEAGDKSDGILVAKRSQVIALDWEGGLTGNLTNNATRINWRNGTWWLKDNQ